MPRKLNDPEQSKRFIEMAREIGAGEKPGHFERVFNKLASRKTRRKSGKASAPSA